MFIPDDVQIKLRAIAVFEQSETQKRYVIMMELLLSILLQKCELQKIEGCLRVSIVRTVPESYA